MAEVEDYIWIRNQFKGVNLPDLRLVDRLEEVACRVMAKPDSSIPKQNREWKDIKGAYRFYDSKKVQFCRLIQPHINQTKKKVAKMKQILSIQDTCFISYGEHVSVVGLSDIGGEAGGKGIILHTALAVYPGQKDPEVVGLLDQHINRRTTKVDKDETYKERQERWRESKIWEETSQRISLNAETQIIEIMDREGDVFDVINNCISLKHDFVIRAKNDRFLDVVSDEKLFTFVRNLKSQGTLTLRIKKRPNQIPRDAILDVAFSTIKIKGPKSRKKEIIKCVAVYVVEKHPPKGQEPLGWILLTSVGVNSFEDACQIIEWYKCRWIIEEYHKAIKSGCKVEERQLKTVERLENFLGIANIVALRLLKLRDAARNTPHILARDAIDPVKVNILIKYRGLKKKDITVYDYYREVAKIGGFIGRKSDGEPGWQTLWKGEMELTQIYVGAKLAFNEKLMGKG